MMKFQCRLLKQNGGVNFQSESDTFNTELAMTGNDAPPLEASMLEYAFFLFAAARRTNEYCPEAKGMVVFKYPLRTHLVLAPALHCHDHAALP